MNSLFLYGILAIVFVICAFAPGRPRSKSVQMDAAARKWGVPVENPDSAVGAGWFVEVDGQRVAELTEPRCQIETPHWLSYVVVPMTDDPGMRSQLADLAFWQSRRPAFRSRKFGVLASGILMSGIPPCPETHRIVLRGPYIQIDPGPSIIERFAGLFKRKNQKV